ncbi:Vps53p [Malassezia vespertilionis]|uniref:Vps53p n=2 Tax=Malassezia vespertilionis TaxID=2020962 RepID=A0A2N1JAQ9_9BASI|nr:Vps53p [Malassezia vespertilionis]
MAAEVNALLTPEGPTLQVADVEGALEKVYTLFAENRAEAESLRAKLHANGSALLVSERNTTMQQLFASLETLEQHTVRAESSVGEVTADIRWLDMAKRNVSLSIVTLKRLQMLVSSTFHLEQLCTGKQYREAASTLEAVQALLAFFEPHADVEYVVQQRRKVQQLREQLNTMVMHEYEQNFQQSHARFFASETVLPDAALAVEALGPKVRDTVIHWYCTRQLREYRRVFRAVDEAGQLDNVPRRYAWFKRILRTHADEHAAAFLPAWHVDQQLLVLFSEITRGDLKSVLVRHQANLDADMLLSGLNATNEFETQMARQYGKPFAEILASQGGEPHRVGTSITAVFSPYMNVFVEVQERRLAELIGQFAQPGTPTGEASAGSFAAQVANHAEEPMKVLLSSTELFWFYRQTLERCAQLGEHAPLRGLAELYAKWLKRYTASVLQPTLRLPARDADVPALCTILNTADYCAMTCTQLEQKLTEKMRAQDASTAPFSLESERDGFFAVVAGTLQYLTRVLYQSTEPAFHSLVRPETPWGQHVAVVDKSPWVDTLASALESIAVLVRQEVENKRYVRSWCDKAVGVVITRFTQAVLRIRPIRQCTAEQLCVDLHHVKGLLLELPHFSATDFGGRSQSNAAMQTHYERYVDKGIARIEPLLQVLASAKDESPSLEDVVNAYRSHIHDQSLPNFQKLLDLKGIRRLDQAPLVEEFLAAIDREATPLPTTSMLSSLQMDPNAEVYAPPEIASDKRGTNDTQQGDSEGSAFVTAPRPTTPNNLSAASRALPDWKRFGSMFGAALGREWRP